MLVGCPTTAYSDFMQGNSTLTVVNRAVKHNPLWLCSTEVAIPEDQRFENLVIVQEEVEDMMLVTSDVDFKVNSRFLLQAYHARVDLQSVEATKFRIALDDGSLKFSLDGNPENYDFRNRKALVVQSGSAMLTIENSIPVDLQLSKDVMSRTFVRAQHIDVEENWVSGTQAVTLIASPHEFGMNLLRQFSSSVSVNVKSHEAPLFITSRPVGADANSMVLDAWAGSEHLVAPHVNAASSQKLETVDEWVTLSAVRRPWIVRLPLLNHYFPGGVWRVLSSPAYLKQPVSFILFSLGLLVPQKQNLNVNIMGLYCRKNIPALQRAQHGHGDWIVKHRVVSSKERWSDVVLQDPLYPGRKLGPVQPFTACKQDLLDNAFLVIYEHFKAFQTKSTLNVWTETEASGGVKEVLFDLRNQAIVKEVVSLKQTWASVFAYLVALLKQSLNILISVTLSFKCLELLYFWFLDHFILAEVVLDNFKASSHRLAFESSHSRGDWILNVFHSREPKGINLKWSVDLDNVDSLEITLVHTNARGELERQVLFVTTPLNITQNRNGVYKLFLPYAHYGETTQLLTCLQTYVLKPYVQYRAKLRGLDETKSVLAESSWSPEIVPGYMTSFLDFPINALGSMMPNLPLSLDTFLSKLTVPNAASSHYYVICAPAVEYVTMRANVRALALDFQMGGDDTTPSSTFNVQKVVVLKTRQHITQPDGSTTYWFEKPEISFRLGRLTPTFQPIKVQIFEHDSGKVVGVGEVTQSLLRRSQTKHFREGDACCGVGLCYEPVVEMPVTNSDGKDKLSVSFKVDMALDKQFLRAIHNTNGITFVNDLAGVTLFTGTEYLLHWHTSPHCNAEWIYLHLADHESNAWICPLNGGKPVPNSGAFMWTVGVPFSGQWFRRVFLLATSQPYMPDSDEEVGVLAQSHGLQVIKSLTLSRFEFAYATFCRSANMEMEAVNINSLRKRGIAARAAVVKCCRDLRTGLAFEGHPVLYTPGQSMVSDESLLVTLKDDLLRDTSIPTTTVFKSVAEEVTILENVALLDDPYWWEMSPDIRVLRANVPLSPLMVWLDKAAPRWITLAMYSWLVDLLVFRGYMKLGSTDESTRFNQALLWDFQVRRMIVFHLFPQLVLVMELFLDIWYFFSPLVQIFCIFFMWNVVYYDTVDTPVSSLLSCHSAHSALTHVHNRRHLRAYHQFPPRIASECTFLLLLRCPVLSFSESSLTVQSSSIAPCL
ncbi:MAG: LOW QUALITY PROTEIN: uncharacterized protein KVP18_002535 [Porospora cf. gigantea A]|uniref:uncharacterized protein n=1 Tax=Porospora cf. gigantea A TaxID=2853593 RepID=UPI00355A23C3|nr:MAG: LOW QUALITY PROTEIN: hypothetical protein KVP18_002535 [Porospora cf. gigantea A]